MVMPRLAGHNVLVECRRSADDPALYSVSPPMPSERASTTESRLVRESPRWLLQHDKLEAAHRSVAFIGRMNGRRPPTIQELSACVVASDDAKSVYSYWDLVRTPKQTLLTVVMCFSWYACPHTLVCLPYNVGSSRHIVRTPSFSIFAHCPVIDT